MNSDSSPRRDVYLTLLAVAADGESATVRLAVNPLVGLVWAGGAVGTAGGLLALARAARAGSRAATATGRAAGPGDHRGVSAPVRRSYWQRVRLAPAAVLLLTVALGAVSMRQVIADQLAQGRSPEEIRRWFVARYGDEVLAHPPAQGLGLLLWVIPATALLGAGVAAARTLRRRHADAGPRLRRGGGHLGRSGR